MDDVKNIVMKNQNDIDNILSSLDEIKRAEARPFMFTRVMARLQKEEKGIWERIGFFIARPIVAVGCFVAVLVANYAVIKANSTSQETTTIASVSNSASDILQGDNYISAVNNYQSNIQP
jgi:hypothetical protein